MFKFLVKWNRRRKYKVGNVFTRLIARDIVRDIKVESIDKLDDGVITVRVRTNNILYVSNGLTEKNEFGKPEEIAIADLWKWSGQGWGGLPDGTSLFDRDVDDGMIRALHACYQSPADFAESNSASAVIILLLCSPYLANRFS